MEKREFKSQVSCRVKRGFATAPMWHQGPLPPAPASQRLSIPFYFIALAGKGRTDPADLDEGEWVEKNSRRGRGP